MRSPSEWLRLPARLFFRQEDERIYAAVRIGFAAVALLNLICLWPDRHVFFSDGGMLDAAVARALGYPVYLSVFAFAHSGAAVTCCMAAAAGALVMLLAGVATRLAAFLVLVWHLSYTARGPLSMGGWDQVLGAYSFLVFVSPAGKCWTLPALLRGGRTPPALLPAYGLVLMRIQVLVIYWQAVLARMSCPDPYWGNGEFMSYFLLSHHARWPGPWVLEYGGLLTFATYAAQITELTIPVLLLVKRTRWWGMLLGFSLHAGISLVARDLGLFFLAMMMTYLACLRAEDIDRITRWVRCRFARADAAPQSN